MPAPNGRLRPSAAYRWMKCTASPALIEEVAPPEKVTKASEEGRKLHEIIESCLRSGEMPEHAADRQRAAVKRALRLSASLRRRFSEWRYEEPLRTRIGGEEISGTIDALGLNRRRNRVCVLDWKFGWRTVRSADNPQLLLYALMAQEYFAAHSEHGIEAFELHVVQPKVRDVEWQTDHAVCTVSQLEDFRRKLQSPVEIIRAGKGAFHPHPDICRYCPVREHCPAL